MLCWNASPAVGKDPAMARFSARWPPENLGTGVAANGYRRAQPCRAKRVPAKQEPDCKPEQFTPDVVSSAQVPESRGVRSSYRPELRALQ